MVFYTSKPIYDETKESKKMGKSFGFTFNASAVKDEDGKANVGIHYTDSEGNDFNREAKGDSIIDTSITLLDGMTKEINAKTKELKEKADNERKARNDKRNELQAKLRDIQAQIDALDKKDAEVAADTATKQVKEDYDKYRNRLKNWMADFGDIWDFGF